MEKAQQVKQGIEVIFNFYGNSLHDTCPLGLMTAFKHLWLSYDEMSMGPSMYTYPCGISISKECIQQDTHTRDL